MSRPYSWNDRLIDMRRHLDDLHAKTYEGASSRSDRDAVFMLAFEYLTPVAVRVLEDVNRDLLEGRGEITTEPPAVDGAGGLEGGWVLTWPAQRAARHRLTGEPIEPLRLVAGFPADFLHAHLIAPMPGMPERVVAWPLQVTNADDAERQVTILRVVAEALLHERVYQAGGNWALLGRSAGESE